MSTIFKHVFYTILGVQINGDVSYSNLQGLPSVYLCILDIINIDRELIPSCFSHKIA